MRLLTYLGSALATYGGLSYFGKSTFLSFMSCLHANRFFLLGMYYLCTLLFIIIKWKDTHQYSSLHSCDSISFLLSTFLCMLVRIISSKIYFLCFFLASLLIALIYYFYRGCNNDWRIIRRLVQAKGIA